MGPSSENSEKLLREVPMFRALGEQELQTLAEVTEVRLYERGDLVFREADPADDFYTVVRGRVKVSKATPSGKDVILEIFGRGDPLGAVAVYEGKARLLRPAASTACLGDRRAPPRQAVGPEQAGRDGPGGPGNAFR